MPTALISAGPLRGKPGPFREILRAAGFDTFLDPPGEGMLTEADLRATLPLCQATIAGSERLSAELMDLAPGLRVIARTGVGYDAVDVAAATARGIAVVITPGTNQESVAEQTFGLLLALTRNIVVNDNAIKAGGWDRNLVRPLRGSTMGLLGLGRIGRAVAARATAFGMRVIGFDPVSSPEDDARVGVTRASFDEVIASADVLSLHLPLVPATANLMDRAAFAMMKRGAILLNTSRGGLVVEEDLYQAVASGHLAGAGLDVLRSEPPERGNPLLTLPNVVISPHLGGIDTKSMADMAELAAKCVADLKRGDWPEGCVVNTELRAGWSWGPA